MKSLLRNVVTYLLGSFLVSFIIYSFSAALFTGNFTQTIIPEAKHLVSYHLWPSSTPAPAATASGIPTDKTDRTSRSHLDPTSDRSCVFLMMWGFLFFYLLFAKYSGLTDTGYICPLRLLYYRRRGGGSDWGE